MARNHPISAHNLNVPAIILSVRSVQEATRKVVEARAVEQQALARHHAAIQDEAISWVELDRLFDAWQQACRSNWQALRDLDLALDEAKAAWS
ncbi:MAG: hypothetical protein EBR99_00035 [Actinobacteria bacterium]|nr:hypothetical protein [Actinomycetota bacterium]